MYVERSVILDAQLIPQREVLRYSLQSVFNVVYRFELGLELISKLLRLIDGFNFE